MSDTIPYATTNLPGHFAYLLGVFGLARGETPEYRVVLRRAGMEVRSYAHLLLMETEVTGDYAAATREGHARLTRYFRGHNSINKTLPTTAPVLMEATAAGWKTSFFLPAHFSFSTTPRPEDPRLRLQLEPAHLKAVLRFQGPDTPEKLDTLGAKLIGILRETPDYVPIGKTMVARYDFAYTLHFLRRNEVQLRVTSGN